MATASGTSVKGLQNLINYGSGALTVASIAITNKPLPPRSRRGYFVLYQFQLASPNQSYIISRGVLYAPGVYLSIPAPWIGTGYGYRLDVDWNESGLPWTAG